MTQSATPSRERDAIGDLIAEFCAKRQIATDLRLARAVHEAVFGMCLEILGSADAARDAEQNVWHRLLTHLNRHEAAVELTNGTAYVRAIARNVCLDQLRRDRTAPVPVDLRDESPGAPANVTAPEPDDVTPARLVTGRDHATALFLGFSSQQVMADMAGLSQQELMVLGLRVNGWSYADIAEKLGADLTEPTAKKQGERAMHHLRGRIHVSVWRQEDPAGWSAPACRELADLRDEVARRLIRGEEIPVSHYRRIGRHLDPEPNRRNGSTGAPGCRECEPERERSAFRYWRVLVALPALLGFSAQVRSQPVSDAWRLHRPGRPATAMGGGLPRHARRHPPARPLPAKPSLAATGAARHARDVQPSMVPRHRPPVTLLALLLALPGVSLLQFRGEPGTACLAETMQTTGGTPVNTLGSLGTTTYGTADGEPSSSTPPAEATAFGRTDSGYTATLNTPPQQAQQLPPVNALPYVVDPGASGTSDGRTIPPVDGGGDPPITGPGDGDGPPSQDLSPNPGTDDPPPEIAEPFEYEQGQEDQPGDDPPGTDDQEPTPVPRQGGASPPEISGPGDGFRVPIRPQEPVPVEPQARQRAEPRTGGDHDARPPSAAPPTGRDHDVRPPAVLTPQVAAAATDVGQPAWTCPVPDDDPLRRTSQRAASLWETLSRFLGR